MDKKTAIHAVPSQAKERAVNVANTPAQRAEVAHALSSFVASTYVLYQKSLFYHWNVTGPNFIGLHSLFEQHYEALHQAGDTLAERIRALGHNAPGTYAEFLSASSVKEDAKLPATSKEMIANLLKAHETCSKQAKQVLETAEQNDDEVSVDLMVQRMTFHDKAAWMLRALQE